MRLLKKYRLSPSQTAWSQRAAHSPASGGKNVNNLALGTVSFFFNLPHSINQKPRSHTVPFPFSYFYISQSINLTDIPSYGGRAQHLSYRVFMESFQFPSENHLSPFH